MNLLIQYDTQIILSLIGLIVLFGAITMRDLVAGMGLGVLIFLCMALVLLTINMFYCVNGWENGTIYKTISIEKLIVVELPNHTIQLWDKETEVKIDTLNSVTESNKNKIDRIEYRRRELFGPDWTGQKVIFKE